LKALKENLARAQNRIKVMADKHRTDIEFQVGDQVLLKLQPYTQSSMANRPFPKLSYKYFGPYLITERIGLVAYRLKLPDDSKIHDVFHVSQLKPFVAAYTPVFSELPFTTNIEATAALPGKILERRLVKRGNAAIPQVLIQWTGLPPTSTTWEDYNVLRQRFPHAPAWGQASTSAVGDVRPGTPTT